MHPSGILRPFLAAALGALLLVGGCDDDDGETTEPDLVTDANIVAVARAANNGEVQTSQPAVTKATAANVRSYAQTMVTDHTAANQQLLALGIAPVDYALSLQLTQTAAAAVQALNAAPAGTAFDRAYMDLQVQLHTAALNAVDTQLLPETQGQALRSYLQQMRTSVAAHLQLATQVRATLP